MKEVAPQYYLDENGRFVIENYNQAKPFSNFFPGIAGLWGIPMWVFYVNRGQCISSFGIESKDKAILEFQPANKAYRLTPLQGFRTFLKIQTGNKTIFYEPFQNNLDSARFNISQRMFITSHDLTLEEENSTLGLSVRVNYFTLPEEPHAALIRRLTIVNDSRKSQFMELIDGLPVIIPYGTNEWTLKNMSRTVEAWMDVSNLKKRAPYYHLKGGVSDRPIVEHIKEGNFYFAFEPGMKGKLLEPIVDNSLVFGASSDFTYPQEFLKNRNYKAPREQFVSNRTPSAMSFTRFSLGAGKEKEIVSLTGYAREEEDLNRFVKKVTQKGFLERKSSRNQEIIEGVKNFALTNSSSRTLNQYAAQTFLDNILRGGLPVSLKTSDGNIAFNVFSRKHGDPERDYNYFVLPPTCFSQGNGNYRDVNQNRRNDVWFNADVKDNSIISFLSLVQADGYNPLIVKGMLFQAVDLKKIDEVLKECVKGEGAQQLRKILQGAFTPGELLRVATSQGVKLEIAPREFLARILSLCHKNETAEPGEGFWTDHWTYNLDLLESYLALYPEQLKNLLLGKKVFSFYHSARYILPRAERYLLTPQGVRQYHSLKDAAEEIRTVHKDHKLRTKHGGGSAYYTHLICKLVSIVANKAASFDPSGVGIEMEADKPNWYDALNGLPGLLGSSICETIELKRLCRFLLKSLDETGCQDDLKVSLFEELAHFVTGLRQVFFSLPDDFTYWQRSNDLKEHYRQRVRLGLDGKEVDVSLKDLREWLMEIIKKADSAVEKAKIKNGLLSAYFTQEVEQYELSDKKNSEGQNFVRPLSFKRHHLPLYLEGFVHALRVEEDQKKARVLYRNVRESSLFDRQLKMYKVNAPLHAESEEIGRCRIFPPGWLENESIWLHMEYKYLLEILRAGLYEEFYRDFKNVLIPFMDPRRYGRSTLENSSFLVSSAHEDKKLHGQGFVARLSGSTAEFLHMWLLMNVGPRPFQLSAEGHLKLTFRPALAAWLFTKEETQLNFLDPQQKKKSIRLPKNTYTCMFLGSTLVVYHNPKRKNTFGKDSCLVSEIHLSFPGKKHPIVVKSSTITGPTAKDVRERKAERIDIFLS